MSGQRPPLLRVIGPGLLVAATGVGAGDLASGAFAGSLLGPAVLWAVWVGALLKFVLSEGLARWQLLSGQTLLEGALLRTARPARWIFLAYLLPWSYVVGGALVGACGVTAAALLPLSGEPLQDKILWGVAHALLGLLLVRRGGFRLFERLMGIAVGLMFVSVVVTAARLGVDGEEVLRGLLVPRVPEADGRGLTWTLALLGGVGGTLTLLCYGYWIREEGRTGADQVGLCRLDLAVGFSVTALFGVGMVLIGSRVPAEGSGSGLMVDLAAELERELGAPARWAFLVGAWAAVFTSLVGVWQAVPYLFADFWRLRRARLGEELAPVDTAGRPYRLFQLALATIPLLGLWTSFREAQKLYAVTGAFFLPGLAAILLVLGRRRFLGGANRPWTVALLVATLLFFLWAGLQRLSG